MHYLQICSDNSSFTISIPFKEYTILWNGFRWYEMDFFKSKCNEVLASLSQNLHSVASTFSRIRFWFGHHFRFSQYSVFKIKIYIFHEYIVTDPPKWFQPHNCVFASSFASLSVNFLLSGINHRIKASNCPKNSSKSSEQFVRSKCFARRARQLFWEYYVCSRKGFLLETNRKGKTAHQIIF